MRRNIILLASLLAMPVVAMAQSTRPAALAEDDFTSRLTIDGTYSKVWFQRPFPEYWTTTRAVGARLTYLLAPATQEQSLRSRLAVGGQFSFTPRETMDFGRYRVSRVTAVADYFPFGYGRRVEPTLSLGAGALQTWVEDQRRWSTVMTIPEGTHTQFAVTPGAGLRVNLANRLGVRAEYRDTFLRYRRWWHAPELSTSASLRL